MRGRGRGRRGGRNAAYRRGGGNGARGNDSSIDLSPDGGRARNHADHTVVPLSDASIDHFPNDSPPTALEATCMSYEDKAKEEHLDIEAGEGGGSGSGDEDDDNDDDDDDDTGGGAKEREGNISSKSSDGSSSSNQPLLSTVAFQPLATSGTTRLYNIHGGDGHHEDSDEDSQSSIRANNDDNKHSIETTHENTAPNLAHDGLRQVFEGLHDVTVGASSQRQQKHPKSPSSKGHSSIGRSAADIKSNVSKRASEILDEFRQGDALFKLDQRDIAREPERTGSGMYAGAGMKQGEI
jgi:hypothetical protein